MSRGSGRQSARRPESRWPSIALVAGWLGVSVFVAGLDWPLRLSFAVRFGLVAIPVALLLAGAIAATAGGSRRLRPALLPLALLAPAQLLEAPWGARAAGLLVLTALLLAAWRLDGARGFPWLAGSNARWRWGLIASTLAIAVVYLVIGSRAEGSQRPDAAYYLGVARHIATSGSFEEPLVWHYLTPPATIVHAPFDYWAPLTSLCLVPVLLAFGATGHVALIAMAVVSALSVIAFGYLAGATPRMRHAPVQLLTVVLFAFSPALASYRFDTESIALFHLVLILALIAFVHERYPAVIVLAFLLLLCRSGAGSIFCIVLWAVCLVKTPRRRTAGLVAAGLVAAYLVYNLALFGAPLPPAARIAPFVGDRLDLLSYGLEHDTSPFRLLSRFAPGNLIDGVRTTVEALTKTELVPAQIPWLVLAALPGFGWFRRRVEIDTLVWLLLFPGAFLIVLATHHVYSDRVPLVLLPVLVLAGGFGLDDLLTRLGRWRASQPSPRVLAMATALALFALGYFYATGTRTYAERGPAWLGTPSLSRLDPILQGQPVATELPYFVAAETRSPAVTLPLNGETAIDEVLTRYGVRWLLLFGTDFSPDPPTEGLVQEILDGRRTRLGSFRLKHVRTRPYEWVLFRLEPKDLRPVARSGNPMAQSSGPTPGDPGNP